jgi:hypothetical protein
MAKNTLCQVISLGFSMCFSYIFRDVLLRVPKESVRGKAPPCRRAIGSCGPDGREWECPLFGFLNRQKKWNTIYDVCFLG